jgi:hypothetical protein
MISKIGKFIKMANMIVPILAQSGAVYAVEMSGIVDKVVPDNSRMLSALSRGVTSELANEIVGLAFGVKAPLLSGDVITAADDSLYYAAFHLASAAVGTTDIAVRAVSNLGLSPDVAQALLTAGASTAADLLKLFAVRQGFAQKTPMNLFYSPLKTTLSMLSVQGGSSAAGVNGSAVAL